MNTHIAGVVDWDLLIGNATPALNAGTTPAEIISQIILFAFPIAGGVLMVYLLVGGFNWMTSGGDPKKVARARGIVTNALVGFVIMFMAYWIVQLIAEVFDIEVLREIF